MGVILNRANDALNVNPPVGDQVLTVHGSDWLWAVFCIYGFVLLAVVVHTRFARQGEKIFHYLFTVSLLVGTICYFAMASDLGSTAIMPANNLSKQPGSRQIFFAKYINWFAAWPPLFVAVGLVSGVSWATIVYNVILGLIYVTSFLVSVMTETKYKWGFYTFGLFAWLLLSHSLIFTPRAAVKRLEVARHYLLMSSFLSFLLLLYPLAIGISDAGNKISTTRGFIFFGILDFLMGPMFALGFVGCSHACDYRKFNIYFTQYGRVATENEVVQREKVPQEAVASSAV